MGLCLSIVRDTYQSTTKFHGMGEQHGQRGPHEYAWEISVIEFELTYIYIYIIIYNIIYYIYYCHNTAPMFRMGSAWVSPTPLGPWDFPRKSVGSLFGGICMASPDRSCSSLTQSLVRLKIEHSLLGTPISNSLYQFIVIPK